MIEKRYEIKYVSSWDKYHEIINKILTLPLQFSEAFCERKISNIYYDTDDFKNYFENSDGTMFREKNRVRWYDDILSDFTYECKIKEGALGWKNSLKVPCEFVELNKDNTPDIFSCHNKLTEFVNTSVSNSMDHVTPKLYNSYYRRYFISKSGNIRITIDKDLEYQTPIKRLYIQSCLKVDKTVIEVKFSENDYDEFLYISRYFENTQSANSKYSEGISSLYNI